MDKPREGSVSFWLRHQHRDWSTNSECYNFGRITISGVRTSCTKYSNRTIEFSIEGPLGHHINLTTRLPKCDQRGLLVAITWRANRLDLYLNGALAGSVSF